MVKQTLEVHSWNRLATDCPIDFPLSNVSPPLGGPLELLLLRLSDVVHRAWVSM